MLKREDCNEEERVLEDDPEYRSVMIKGLRAPTMPIPLAPLPTLSDSSIKTLDRKSGISKLNRSSSLSLRWKVFELSELPHDYMLVRTNVYIKDSRPQEIADKIYNALRSLSISIDPRVVKEENSLVVETQQGIKLTISLFSHNDMVVVEVRRQIGCTFEFRDAAKAILRASKGLQQGWKSFASRRFSIPPTFPKRSREIQHKCIRGDFRIARTMLQSKNYDALVLALESIEKMTKSCGAKDVVAKSVICNDCLKHLLFLLDTCNDIDRNGMEYGNSSVLPRKILGVIANSCEAIGKSDLELVLSANDNDLKTRWFLSLLLSTIQDAPSRPHDAFEAVRCLGQLLISKEVESVMVEKSAIDVISSARIAGFTCHQGLEQECNKLMLRLENVGYEED